jgi:hypothetical protein
MKPLVFLGMPRYNHTVDARAFHSFWVYPTDGSCDIHFGYRDGTDGSPCEIVSSLLNFSFNQLLASALNLRDKYRISHFAMLHADVEARPNDARKGWVDTLVAEQQRTGADIISAVIPFKDYRGLSSTALGDPNAPRGKSSPLENPRRITMTEAHELPETFNAADATAALGEPGKILLLNTGCMVWDFSKPWVDQFADDGGFQSYDSIPICPDGRRRAECRGEDWAMSFWAHDHGLKVFATRAQRCIHHGSFGYSNWPAWGEQKTDEQYHAAERYKAEIAGAAPSSPPCPVQ